MPACSISLQRPHRGSPMRIRIENETLNPNCVCVLRQSIEIATETLPCQRETATVPPPNSDTPTMSPSLVYCICKTNPGAGLQGELAETMRTNVNRGGVRGTRNFPNQAVAQKCPSMDLEEKKNRRAAAQAIRWIPAWPARQCLALSCRRTFRPAKIGLAHAYHRVWL